MIVLCQDRSRRRRWPKASLYKGLSPSHARPTDGHVGVCPARGCPRETRQSAPGWWVRKMSTPRVHSRERQGAWSQAWPDPKRVRQISYSEGWRGPSLGRQYQSQRDRGVALLRKELIERRYDFVRVALDARHALGEGATVDGKAASVTAEAERPPRLRSVRRLEREEPALPRQPRR